MMRIAIISAGLCLAFPSLVLEALALHDLAFRHMTPRMFGWCLYSAFLLFWLTLAGITAIWLAWKERR